MKFPEPVTHEFGCFLHVTDLDFYLAVVSYYSNNVTDSYNHYIKLGNRKFRLWSYQGGLYNPKTKKLAFEYKLQWTDKDGASSCDYTIKPLFGRGTKTKKGKTFNVPEIGTQIQVESSFIDLDEHFDIIFEFMDYLDASRFQQKIDHTKSPIYQCARHLRYHERHEHAMGEILKVLESESNTRGKVKLVKDMDAGKYKMYKLDDPDYSIFNIKTEYPHSIKTYRIKNFLERKPEDPLRHPKLEAFLKSRPKHNPTIAEYLALKKDLDKLLYSFLSFIAPVEYVSDNYFDAERVFEYRYDLPEWDNSNNKEQDDFIIPEEATKKIIKVLVYVSLYSEGCVEFRELQERTGIPERTLWRYINYWKSLGILDTVRDRCTKVFFTTKRAWEATKGPLTNFCSSCELGFKQLFGHVFEDSGVIRPFKERKKNLKPLRYRKQPELEPIIVDTYQQAKKLVEEIKELGAYRKVAIRSNYNTMRYSRVI